MTKKKKRRTRARMNHTRRHGKIHTCHASRMPIKSQNDCRKSAQAQKEKGKSSNSLPSGLRLPCPMRQHSSSFSFLLSSVQTDRRSPHDEGKSGGNQTRTAECAAACFFFSPDSFLQTLSPPPRSVAKTKYTVVVYL